MKKAVVTGATSFLGRYLVRELCARGYAVSAIIRPTSKSIGVFEGQVGVTTVPHDMDDVEGWCAAIGGADVFFHLGWDGIGAAGRSNMEIQEKNVRDALACLRGAHALGCKSFLFAGSQAEYGPKTALITEEDSCAPVINYGKGKLMVCEQATELAALLDITYYHTRIFSVYGIGDHPWALVPSAVKAFCDGEEKQLSSCRQSWNYMYVTDAVRDLVALAESGADAGIYNVASRDTRELRAFVEEMLSACGKGRASYGTYDPAEQPVSLIPDVGKLEKAIGVLPETPFDEGIRALVTHYLKTGEL